jgi:hypothetical protein
MPSTGIPMVEEEAVNVMINVSACRLPETFRSTEVIPPPRGFLEQKLAAAGEAAVEIGRNIHIGLQRDTAGADLHPQRAIPRAIEREVVRGEVIGQNAHHCQHDEPS